MEGQITEPSRPRTRWRRMLDSLAGGLELLGSYPYDLTGELSFPPEWQEPEPTRQEPRPVRIYDPRARRGADGADKTHRS